MDLIRHFQLTIFDAAFSYEPLCTMYSRVIYSLLHLANKHKYKPSNKYL